MAVVVAVVKETKEHENRVALDPSLTKKFTALGAEIRLQKDAGEKAFFNDSQYADVTLVDSAEETVKNADIVLAVNTPDQSVLSACKPGAILLCFMDPYRQADAVKFCQSHNITALPVELVPRISRAQSMDALSSQAALSGYKCALRAADLAFGFFPMLTTAAGTIRPAKVVVIGAGVAGLQAIATAKRLGAQVEAYDIRSAAKEQVESLGAKLIDTGVSAEGEGGYARELTEEEKQQQADVLAKHIAAATAVISTAAVPGRPAPKIITKAMVENMKPGAVIVDMAAETGGNCELTEAGKTVIYNQVKIDGPTDIPSSAPLHASEMYAKNLFNLINLMIVDGNLQPNWEDEVLAGTCATRDGEIVHAQLKSVIKQSNA